VSKSCQLELELIDLKHASLYSRYETIELHILRKNGRDYSKEGGVIIQNILGVQNGILAHELRKEYKQWNAFNDQRVSS